MFRSSSKSLPPFKPVAAPVTPQVVPPSIKPVQALQPPKDPETSLTDPLKDQSLFEPPSAEALFSRLDSEKMFEQRLRQQGMQRNPPETVKFPDRPVLTRAAFVGRTFPRQVMVAEPTFLCYNRLFFEEKNAERYGWDLGFIQPVISTLYFYKDVALFPHNFFKQPCRRYECSAGYCLPGDPVPYIFYPPELSLTGSIAEAAIAVGLFAVIP